MKIRKVIVKTPKKGKKWHVLHDQEITPPRTSDQILTTLKQQFDVLGFTAIDGVATAIVGKKNDAE